MSEPSYYERNNIVYLDGTNIFLNAEDQRNENEVAKIVEKAWDCSIIPFAALCPIDWYAKRYERLVGVLELKTRSHESTRFSTVFLGVRKWLALTMGAFGLGCPAIFVVKFTDGVFWTPLASVDASQHKIGGGVKLVKNAIEPLIEPLIEVPIADMRKIEAGQ